MLSGCGGPNAAFHSVGVHDFPPLVDPDAPAPSTPGSRTANGASSQAGFDGASDSAPTEFRPSDAVRVPQGSNASAEDFAYRFGVSDEVTVVVIGQPEYTRSVKVLPDGSFRSTGTGNIYVLGKTVEEATQEVQERLKATIRYPQVDLVVTRYGEHVVYMMGEVNTAADHPYRKGMTALQAIGAAGGFKNSAKRENVCVFRRTGPTDAELIQLDLKSVLDGNFQDDIMLRPYDIVYVPKSKIGNVNAFIDQYFRQTLSAFNFYLAGWDAYSVTKDRVTIQRNQ